MKKTTYAAISAGLTGPVLVFGALLQALVAHFPTVGTVTIIAIVILGTAFAIGFPLFIRQKWREIGYHSVQLYSLDEYYPLRCGVWIVVGGLAISAGFTGGGLAVLLCPVLETLMWVIMAYISEDETVD